MSEIERRCWILRARNLVHSHTGAIRVRTRLAIPAQKITASRESVLVAFLKESPPSPYPGPFERLASLPPKKLQDLFRRAIRSYGGRVGDLDWDHALAQVKVMDLALLAERLGLARIIRDPSTVIKRKTNV